MRPKNQILISKAIAAVWGPKEKKHLSPIQIERELRKDKIRAILKDANVEVDESLGVDSLSFYNPDSLGGVANSLDRLVYDESDSDPTVPWLPRYVQPEQVKSLIKSLKVPAYAEWFRDSAAEKVSLPNTFGMLTKEGQMNKDLSQLASPRTAPKLSNDDSRLLELAIEYTCREIIEELDKTESNFYQASNNGKYALRPWSLSDFTGEMRKAISHSSPGYPYNGLAWTDELECGTPVYEAVYNDGIKLLEASEPEPFIFIQGARYTGDGESEGQQRLVQQSPANEKLIGHILAYPFKKAIRKPGSGQLGIQQASLDMREMARGNYSNFRKNAPSPKYFMENDVSQWDAHINDYQVDLFRIICERVLDMSDEFTRRVVETYFDCFDQRYLVTGVGGVKTRMLPSGCAITTVFAFCIHQTYVRFGDMKFCCPDASSIEQYENCEKFGIVSLGLQGDDLWALTNDIGVRETLIGVYSLFGAKMKEGSRYGSLSEENPCMVFLNELVHLKEDVPNVVVPRWNMFYSETADQNFRTMDINRTLYDEITSKVPHVTPVELTFARFVGKMRRYADMPFFEYLTKKLWTGLSKNGKVFRQKGMFDLRSWLGERIFSEDEPVIKLLAKFEANYLPEDKRRPDELEVRMFDRQECAWLDAYQLMSAYYLGFMGASKLGRHEYFNKMKSIAKTTHQERFIKRITAEYINNDNYSHLKGVHINEEIMMEALDFFEEVAMAVMSHYAEESQPEDSPSEEEQLVAEMGLNPKKVKSRKPLTPQTSTSALLSANCVDPFAVVHGALKECSALYELALEEGDEEWAKTLVRHAGRLLSIPMDVEGFNNALDVINAYSEERHRKSDPIQS